jgi:tetratricopeptide (TPR) repeat protein
MPILWPEWTHEEIYYISQRGHRLYREGRLREAAALFEGLIAIDPDNAYCRKALAAICMRLDRYDAAVIHLDAVLALSPRDTDALAGRCEALIATRDVVAARRDLEVLAALPAGAADVRRLRLQLEHQSGASPQLPAGAADNSNGW